MEIPNIKRTALVLLLVLAISPHASVWSGGWGRVFALEIRSDTLAQPLTITDPRVVEELSFWVGPGTNFREFMGPVSLDRSIIDWDRGPAADLPVGLMTYEVRFLLEPQDDPPEYLVLYAPDPQNGSGYIYTPASSGHIVTHGVADAWMYASERWNARVGAAINKQLLAELK